MPEFAPGESKTAIAPITVSPSGLSCEAEVFLGPDEATKVATSGRIPFASTGYSQNVRLAIAMPSAEGTYHVFIDVYAEGLLIAAYQAIEDVVIATPAPPVPLCPCVYCGATFTSEADLVSHMESNHPGKPYLVYAYPVESEVASGEWLNIRYKVFTPAVPGTETTASYFFTFYIPDFVVWEPFNGAYVDLRGGTPAGFYEGVSGMWIKYIYAGHWEFYLIPPGTYPLYSRCRHRADVGEYEWGTIKTFWSGVDTGQTITVV